MTQSSPPDSPGKLLAAKRKKELKTCPTPGCGFQHMAYVNALDLCPRCQRNARQKKFRDNKKIKSTQEQK
jgi:hypothetical protein